MFFVADFRFKMSENVANEEELQQDKEEKEKNRNKFILRLKRSYNKNNVSAWYEYARKLQFPIKGLFPKKLKFQSRFRSVR